MLTDFISQKKEETNILGMQEFLHFYENTFIAIIAFLIPVIHKIYQVWKSF